MPPSFCVDEGADAAEFLRLGDAMDGERGLAGGFGAEDLDDAPSGYAANAERRIERERSGRDDAYLDDRRVAHAHDRSFAELLFDLF